MLGAKLGQYELIEELGRGGMATVYRAYQRNVDRFVAVKVIHHNIALDPTALERFTREARVIARLEHPHILPVYDYDGQNDPPYIVMRYLPTGTLKDILEHGQLPLPDVANLLGQIGSALDYAHRQGVVHRDIKPSNIMVDTEGNAFLTDFGIARLMESSAALTASGMAVGTPGYMAPEQGLGVPIDGRADIYALGVMLYEMLVGQVPYTAETPMGVILKHISDPIPEPTKANPALPPAVDQVIKTAMAKQPDDRYSTAMDLSRALNEALGIAQASTPSQLRAVAGQTIVDLDRQRRSTYISNVGRGSQPSGSALRGAMAGAAVFIVLVILVGGAFVFISGKNSSDQTATFIALAAASSATHPATFTPTNALPVTTLTASALPPTVQPSQAIQTTQPTQAIKPTQPVQPSVTVLALIPTNSSPTSTPSTAPTLTPTVQTTMPPTLTSVPPTTAVPVISSPAPTTAAPVITHTLTATATSTPNPSTSTVAPTLTFTAIPTTATIPTLTPTTLPPTVAPAIPPTIPPTVPPTLPPTAAPSVPIIVVTPDDASWATRKIAQVDARPARNLVDTWTDPFNDPSKTWWEGGVNAPGDYKTDTADAKHKTYLQLTAQGSALWRLFKTGKEFAVFGAGQDSDTFSDSSDIYLKTDVRLVNQGTAWVAARTSLSADKKTLYGYRIELTSGADGKITVTARGILQNSQVIYFQGPLPEGSSANNWVSLFIISYQGQIAFFANGKLIGSASGLKLLSGTIALGVEPGIQADFSNLVLRDVTPETR